MTHGWIPACGTVQEEISAAIKHLKRLGVHDQGLWKAAFDSRRSEDQAQAWKCVLEVRSGAVLCLWYSPPPICASDRVNWSRVCVDWDWRIPLLSLASTDWCCALTDDP